MDSLVHFFANHVVATFLVIVAVGFMVTRGMGGAFLGRLLFILIFAFVVLVMVTSCIQSVSDKWDAYLREDAGGFAKWAACKILGADTACTLLDMGQVKTKDTDKRMQCVENTLKADANDGGDAVKKACGLRGDPAAWEQCVDLEAKKYEKLEADLGSCAAYTPRWSFMHDLIEPIACPLGIKWWCTTGTQQNVDNKPYVYHKDYLQCLVNAVNSQSLDGSGCDPLRSDLKAWDACVVGVINKGMSPGQAKAWLDACAEIRSRPSST
jgi:hypothetical protein